MCYYKMAADYKIINDCFSNLINPNQLTTLKFCLKKKNEYHWSSPNRNSLLVHCSLIRCSKNVSLQSGHSCLYSFASSSYFLKQMSQSAQTLRAPAPKSVVEFLEFCPGGSVRLTYSFSRFPTAKGFLTSASVLKNVQSHYL